ncbi:MAG: hypothetical protein HYZ75_13310 [Elusimicrobia bacterium]|nr:hypothetical protein [Elusimicrobiota bacterium]
MSGTRVACLIVPSFPLAARLRGEPETRPLALLDGPRNAPVVVALNEEARRAGLRTGLSLPQARSLLPGLEAKPRDLEAERGAREALLEAAAASSPVVEEGGLGLLYLDWTGMGDERSLMRSLTGACLRAGLPAQVGVAGGRLAARLAAPNGTVVLPGEDAWFLAAQPGARLGLSEEAATALSRWGLYTVGAFAALPAGEVEARLGREGLELHRAARGLDDRPLIGVRGVRVPREGLELDWVVADLEALLEAASRPLARLAARLAARGEACRALTADLSLDPVGKDQRTVSLAAPSAELKTWLALLRLEWSERPPSAGVTGLSFAAEPVKARRTQLGLFGPAAQSPDALAGFLVRLSALLGPRRLGSPRAVDSRRPELFDLSPYAPPPPPEETTSDRALSRGSAASEAVGAAEPDERLACVPRALRPPVELEVLVEPEELRPLRLSGGDIAGAVQSAAGPWRMEEGWWNDVPEARDYWDVGLSDGGAYRVFRDRRSGRWYADGIYD